MEEKNKNMKKKKKQKEKINRKERVNRREKKKKEEEKLLLRPWDALPNLALFNIFRNLHFKDGFGSFPLVCKAWNSVISDDPRCYSSMIPDSISPDDAFINKPPVYYSNQVYNVPSKLLLYCRVSYLQSFIKKSSSSSCSSVGGGSSSSTSTITSLCLYPFSFSYPNNESMHHDEILHLIAHSCPNLKHISFDGFYSASIEAVLEVFHRCNKIELIDFSLSGYADSVEVIKELGNCLPNLRGIRIAGYKYYSIYAAIDYTTYIATHFPWIKLHYEKLRCYECKECDDIPVYVRESLCRVCVNWPRLQPRDRQSCYQYCWPRVEEEEEEVAEAADEAYLEYLHGDEEDREYSILKEKKERRRYHQYVRVVLRSTRMTKKNKKKQQQQQVAASFILKMKMRKKKDTYNDYQDFYVRAAAF